MKAIENKLYETPEVELVEVNVEQGFAASSGSGSGEQGGAGGGSGW